MALEGSSAFDEKIRYYQGSSIKDKFPIFSGEMNYVYQVTHSVGSLNTLTSIASSSAQQTNAKRAMPADQVTTRELNPDAIARHLQTPISFVSHHHAWTIAGIGPFTAKAERWNSRAGEEACDVSVFRAFT